MNSTMPSSELRAQSSKRLQAEASARLQAVCPKQAPNCVASAAAADSELNWTAAAAATATAILFQIHRKARGGVIWAAEW